MNNSKKKEQNRGILKETRVTQPNFDYLLDSTTSIHFIPSKFDMRPLVSKCIRVVESSKWSKLRWVTLYATNVLNHGNACYLKYKQIHLTGFSFHSFHALSFVCHNPLIYNTLYLSIYNVSCMISLPLDATYTWMPAALRCGCLSAPCQVLPTFIRFEPRIERYSTGESRAALCMQTGKTKRVGLQLV